MYRSSRMLCVHGFDGCDVLCSWRMIFGESADVRQDGRLFIEKL